MQEVRKYRWGILAIGSLTQSIFLAILVAYSVCLPGFMKNFSISETMANYGFSIYTAGMVIGLMLGGHFADVIGRKKTVILAWILVLIPQFIIPSVPYFWLILLLRGIQGIGCMMWTALVVQTVEWFPTREKGLAAGIFFGVAFAGTSVGSIIAGYAFPLGLGMTYYILGIIGVVVVSIYAATAKDFPISVSEKFKKVPTKEGGWRDVFAIRETWFLALIMVCCTWIMYGLLAEIPVFAYSLKYTPAQVGFLSTSTAIGFLVSAVIAGVLSDKISIKLKNPAKGRPLTMIIGFVICIFGLISIAVVGAKSFIALYLTTLIAIFGISWPQAAYWALPTEIYPPEIAGRGAGFTGCIGNIPDPISPIVILAIALSIGWPISWAICAMISVVGLIAAYILSNVGKVRGR